MHHTNYFLLILSLRTVVNTYLFIYKLFIYRPTKYLIIYRQTWPSFLKLSSFTIYQYKLFQILTTIKYRYFRFGLALVQVYELKSSSSIYWLWFWLDVCFIHKIKLLF